MIKAEHLTKSYRKKTAVDDLSFTVESGKVTGFLGPNGAGKSTAMRLMLGLDRVTARTAGKAGKDGKGSARGTTTFDGQPLHEYVRPSEMVGILLEAKAFHPTRSARNHLRVLAAASGVSDKRVDEVLDIVGLSTAGRRKPGKFSLGMSQRLGIAAAILGEPRHLLLDEPANGLDPEGIVWLREFIRDYAAKGNAVFVSSHLLSEMAQMADNVVVIGQGKLIADTSMASLIARSKHAGVFVRSPSLPRLEMLLRRLKVAFEAEAAGLTIKAPSTDAVGRLAHKYGIPLLELTQRHASLEEAFLELTEGRAEYNAQAGGPSTGPPTGMAADKKEPAA